MPYRGVDFFGIRREGPNELTIIYRQPCPRIRLEVIFGEEATITDLGPRHGPRLGCMSVEHWDQDRLETIYRDIKNFLDHEIGNAEDQDRRLAVLRSLRPREAAPERREQEAEGPIEEVNPVRLTGLYKLEDDTRSILVTFQSLEMKTDVIELFTKGPGVVSIHEDPEDNPRIIIDYDSMDHLAEAVITYGPMVQLINEDPEEEGNETEEDPVQQEGAAARIPVNPEEERYIQEWQERSARRTETADRPRLHVLIPHNRTFANFMEDFSKYGPIDYIIAKQQGPGTFFGYVQYYNIENAERAMNGRTEYRPRLAPPRILPRTVKNYEVLKYHRECENFVTRSEYQNHEQVCRFQRSKTMKYHDYCAQNIRGDQWEEHVEQCRRRFDYYAPKDQNIIDLQHFLQQDQDLINLSPTDSPNSTERDLQGLF